MGAILDRSHITASEQERLALETLRAILQEEGLPKLVGSHGDEIVLPESAHRLLQQVIDELTQGHAVSIIPAEKELSTQEAADLLRVSRSHLIKLLDKGLISFRRKGTHRRIRFDDLMRYKQERDAQKLRAIEEIAQMSQDLGLYEEGC